MVFAQSLLHEIEKEQVKIFEEVSPSVVFIATEKGFGSGFYVSPHLILTNAHVVQKTNKVNIILRGGKRIEGQVIDLSENIDLALIKVSTKGKPLPLIPSSAIKVGSWVAAVGHGEGGIWTYTKGMVSNLYWTEKNGMLIQTQIPINHGNSGGPIVNRKGQVVGVATAKSTRGENLNFAIPVEDALHEFEAFRQKCESCVRIIATPQTRIFIDGKLIGKGPCVILLTSGQHQLLSIHNSRTKKETITIPLTRTIKLK